MTNTERVTAIGELVHRRWLIQTSEDGFDREGFVSTRREIDAIIDEWCQEERADEYPGGPFEHDLRGVNCITGVPNLTWTVNGEVLENLPPEAGPRAATEEYLKRLPAIRLRRMKLSLLAEGYPTSTVDSILAVTEDGLLVLAAEQGRRVMDVHSFSAFSRHEVY